MRPWTDLAGPCMQNMVIKRAACHQSFAVAVLYSVMPIYPIRKACMLVKPNGDFGGRPVVRKMKDFETIVHAGRQ